MKLITVLMFGWEFPPHISGGLGTACYGLTKALIEENTNVLFVVPKAHGDEAVPLINSSDILVDDLVVESESVIRNAIGEPNNVVAISVESKISPYTNPEQWSTQSEVTHWNYQFDTMRTREVKCQSGRKYAFSGSYGPSLLDEVKKYSEVAAAIAKKYSFDVIHAHDWLTYLAGIEARKVSGKPLIVHVHATEFDRAGEENIDQRVFQIEQRGFSEADRVITVSQWTKDILINKYHVDPAIIEVVHNGVIRGGEKPIVTLPKVSDKVVTFLGRITWQKGPQYFIEAAWKVLHHFPDTHFIMAGSGDLLPKMIELVAQLKMSDHFHFTGFLKGKQIDHVWNVSDVYVMPSVSEPFGITPLEAMHAGVPVIVSNQSGVAEVLDHAIKVDFWDTDALADSIMNVIKHKSLSLSLKTNGASELYDVSWGKAANKINKIYHEIHEEKSTIH